MNTIAEKLTAVAENVPKVYQAGFTSGEEQGYTLGREAGHSTGYSEGYGKGYGDGETSGYNSGLTEGHEDGYTTGYSSGSVSGANNTKLELWNSITNNNQRTNYNYGFAYSGFEYIRPPYKINMSVVDNFNYLCAYMPNLKKFESSYFDFSGFSGQGGSSMFQQCTNLEEIDLTGVKLSTYSSLFRDCTNLKKIKNLPPPSSTLAYTTFQNCTLLTDITIDGTFTRTAWFECATALSKQSIYNIFESLSTEDSGSSCSIGFNPDTISTAFETSPGAMDGQTSSEWIALTGSRPLWTVSLRTH